MDFEGVVRKLRDGPPLHSPKTLRRMAREEAKRRNPKAVTRLFLREPGKLGLEDRRYLRELEEVCLEAAEAYRLAQHFSAVVRGRKSEELRAWPAEASASKIRAFRDFSEGLRKDEAAVKAALELPEQRTGRGPDKQAEAAQAADVRAGRLRPAQAASASGRLTAEPGSSR